MREGATITGTATVMGMAAAPACATFSSSARFSSPTRCTGAATYWEGMEEEEAGEEEAREATGYS